MSHFPKTKCILTTLAICTLALTPCRLVADEEVLIDLQGGYLLGIDHDLGDPEDFKDKSQLSLHFDVLTDQDIRVINGNLVGGLRGWWDCSLEFTLLVDGNLVFGDNFPVDEIYIDKFYWTIDINGTLRIENQNTVFHNGRSPRVNISEDGILEIAPHTTVQLPSISSFGTIAIEQFANVSNYQDTSRISGNGTVILGNNATYQGTILGQQIFMNSDSEISPAYPTGSSFFLPMHGAATISPWSLIDNCDVVIQVRPSVESLSTINAQNLRCKDDLLIRNSTISLLQCKETNTGSVHPVLRMTRQSESLQSVTLVPPLPTLENTFVLRWGPNGLYVLTVPLNWCEADLNFDGQLNFFDISAFINHFLNESPWANMTSDQNFNFFDVSNFINLYSAGCP